MEKHKNDPAKDRSDQHGLFANTCYMLFLNLLISTSISGTCSSICFLMLVKAGLPHDLSEGQN